jgi:hypothetical protein
MAVAFPGASGAYRAARDRLVDQEIELRRAMEAVADARRRPDRGGQPADLGRTNLSEVGPGGNQPLPPTVAVAAA